MIKFPRTQLFSILTIVIILLTFLVFAPEYTFIHFINAVFYIFSLSLITMLFLLIKKGGIFDGVAFGMHRFRSMMSKNVADIDSWKEKAPPSTKVNQSFYSVLKLQVLYQFILLALLLFVYYIR